MPVREEEVEGGLEPSPEREPQNLQSIPIIRGTVYFLPDTQSNQRINGVNISLLLRHLSNGVEISPLIIALFFHYSKKMLHKNKAKFSRHLSD